MMELRSKLMDGISRFGAPAIPSFGAFSPKEAAARLAVEDNNEARTGGANNKPEPSQGNATLFLRSTEQVRRLARHDEITQIRQLVEEEGGRTEIQSTEVLITREPVDEEDQRKEPGQLLDILA